MKHSFFRCLNSKLRILATLALLATSGKASEPRVWDLSTQSWRLWPDSEAKWESDKLYLPEEVDLANMPMNPPTGGWEALNDQKGISVTLPSSVEEHFWGKFGLRPYKGEIFPEGKTDAQNGNYKGVSWWWRHFQAPPLSAGQRLVLHFPAARLRAEVYCNGKLVGYNLIGETPFDVDLTEAAKAGKDNVLAVRITNPGGRMDWEDRGGIKWGEYILPSSHGFGGLDAGIELRVRDAVEVSDLAILNMPDLHKVKLLLEVKSTGPAYKGPVQVQVTREGKTLWKKQLSVTVSAGGLANVSEEVVVDQALPWTTERPVLYLAKAELPKFSSSSRQTQFGFRFLEATGIGKEAQLLFNGKRMVLKSAISWNFWSPNGLWPSKALAQKEITTAKSFGLNWLHGHRNIINYKALDAADQMGLLRWQEPGSGQNAMLKTDQKAAGPTTPRPEDLTGKGGEAANFTQKYMEEKIMRMIRRDRSHPSMAIWCVQNEYAPNLANPRLFYLFHKMQELDPSRIIVLQSGNTNNNIIALPYREQLLYDDGGGFCGWSDWHTCVGPGTYQDSMYTNSNDYSHLTTNRREIVVWGETLGSGCIDDHETMVRWYQEGNRPGYDRADHEAILAAYTKFMDEFGFRSDFPTPKALFYAIGERSYGYWRKVLEQMRASDPIDGIVVSGWESTAVENHSGIVDNQRNFKADPKLISEVMVPEMLVVRPRHLVVPKGDDVVVDVLLVNETGRCGPHTLLLEAFGPDGAPIFSGTNAVSVAGNDVYGQTLRSGWTFKAPQAGMVKLKASLLPPKLVAGSQTKAREAESNFAILPEGAEGFAVVGSDKMSRFEPLTKEEQLLVVDVKGAPLKAAIGIVESGTGTITKAVEELFGKAPQKFEDAKGPLDVVLFAVNGAWAKPAITGEPKKKAAPPAAPNAAQKRMQALADQALEKISKEGGRLVFWTGNREAALQAAQVLADKGIVKYEGSVGPNAGGAWTGAWYFVRKHPLFDGLPTGCSMDWRYQTVAGNTDGLLISAPGMEVAAGYGRDHQPKVGVAACTIPYGKGQIVLLTLPGLHQGLMDNPEPDYLMVKERRAPGYDQQRSRIYLQDGMHHVIVKRLLGNVLR